MTSHDLRLRRRELLDELDELDEAIVELTTTLRESAEIDEKQRTEYHERLGWLQRQQASIRVVLGETERELLALGIDGWDET